MTEGWICTRCGNSNSPLLLVCGCSSVTTASAATAPQQGTAEAPQSDAEGKKAVASKTSTTKSKYEYKDPAFLQFWEVYPLRREKADAYRKWQQVTAAGIDPDRIIAAAAAYAADPRRDPDYTKYPSGWLAAGRWDDEAAPVSHPAAAVPDIDFEAQQAVRMAEEDAALARFDIPEEEFHAIVDSIGVDE